VLHRRAVERCGDFGAGRADAADDLRNVLGVELRVARVDALGRKREKKVDVIPPDPLGELGSGWEKIQKDKSRSLPVVR